MVFNTGAALLDAIVLAVVSKEPEGTYGYKITQEVRQVIELSRRFPRIILISNKSISSCSGICTEASMAAPASAAMHNL